MSLVRELRRLLAIWVLVIVYALIPARDRHAIVAVVLLARAIARGRE